MTPLLKLIATPWGWLLNLLCVLVGELSWRPAGWQRWLAQQIGAQPKRWAGSSLALIALTSAAWWWHSRPVQVDPEALQVALQEPEFTDYYRTPAHVDVLQLNFSGSAAPIELLYQSAAGVRLDPPLEGSWTWQSDDSLHFQPSKDWPVGQRYRVHIDPLLALAPGRKLGSYELEFRTRPFDAKVASREYYQDPQDSSIKRGVYTIEFSHPVDVAAFERALSLHLQDGAKTALPTPALSVSYDETRLRAFVQSAALSIPDNGGELNLSVASGLRSSLGGAGTVQPLDAAVNLPSLYSVTVVGVGATLVDNERFEPEQLLLVDFNDELRDKDVGNSTRAWLLPSINPKDSAKREHYSWSSDEVTGELLRESTELKLEALPAEREFVSNHSFRFSAPPKRRLLVEIERKGLRSFGGFLMDKKQLRIVVVPDFPELLRFVGDGALLSLKGERRISVAARNVPGLSLEVGRVKPDQLQHLAKLSYGDYARPSLHSISSDALVERFHHHLPLHIPDPSHTAYEGIDLGEYFRPDRHGVFLLRLYRHDPKRHSEGIEDQRGAVNSYDGQGWDGATDSRLVVLTDLGMVVKRAMDGSRSVFVMSISAGTPVAGARVNAVAINGEVLIGVSTDQSGHASLPDLAGFKREKEAVMLTVQSTQDLSFLPLSRHDRELELSRFDIGGEVNATDPGTLKAYLFSDRGLYRPGDELHIGLIVRAADWSQELAGIPLEYRLHDPVGNLVQRERLNLPTEGFAALDYTPSFTAPTGSWEASIYLIGEDDRHTLLGSTTVQVRDFLPDRLKARARFADAPNEGWLAPEALRALVTVENLFGSPAQDRRVSANLLLQPAFPAFSNYPDFQFYDPQRAKEGYTEELPDLRTDANGQAEFAIDLSQFDRATYQLRLLTQSFEAGGGRGVAAQSSVLVSSNPYLIGIKSVDSLSYVQRGAKRSLQIVALAADAKATSVAGLSAVLIERRYVSVLTKQDSGLYKYVSQKRLDERDRRPLSLPADTSRLALQTDTPGDFVLEIRDGADQVLNSVTYSVAGAANLTRSLERNAELGLTLSKTDYRPGEDIELSLRAPYSGAGLITIERDKVYAHAWFQADTTSSVQRIRLPEGFEGHGYVHVQFVRDPDSDEVFMSPLSYALAPFSADLGARRLGLELETPGKVRPGEIAEFALSSSQPALVALFAVDEGILQVASYKLGDPLEFFFTKKMLQVSTAQILDLILPEFSKLAGMAAPGGDAEGLLAKNLNPFKRKGDRPAVYWSGLVRMNGQHTFHYQVPDSFNGKLRVMAVAVNAAQVGITQSETLVRGDFVLSPNAPTQVAPGDEFEVSVGVANLVEGQENGDTADGDAAMPIAVSLNTSTGLSVLDGGSQELQLAPGEEGVARFRVRAGAELGAPQLRFRAQHEGFQADRQIDLSLRPGLVYRSDVQVGFTDERFDFRDLREMYPQLAKRHAATSTVPLVLASGLGAYLSDYPHACTEQLLSQAFPALVFTSHPEFGAVSGGSPGKLAGIIAMLRERKNASGSIGLWRASLDNSPFLSVYAALYLIEASERGQAVPKDLLDALNAYLQRIAGDAARTSMSDYRARAMAVYLLTRQGRTTTNLLAGLQEQLDRNMPAANGPGYRDDAIALFLAASYEQLKQNRPARKLLSGPLKRLQTDRLEDSWPRYQEYYDEAIGSAWAVYLVARHFPDERKKLGDAVVRRMIEPLRHNQYNTLSSALTILALEAWGTQLSTDAPPTLLAVGPAPQRETTAIGEIHGLLRAGSFADGLSAIAIEGKRDATAWFSISQAGFDLQPPPATQYRGLELIRDYLDANGQPLTTIRVGDELTVRLRLRALDREAVDNVAIIDLLPGGFEVVMQTADDPNEGGDEYAEDGPPTAAAAPSLALAGTSLHTEYEEIREDRVVLYARASRDVLEYQYRIKATAIGRFKVAAAYAESMYERQIFAQGGPAAELVVVAAE